jgi:3-phosphoshikimate 1-carboxyvinyltransferase
MQVTIQPSFINGTIAAPPSKSHMQRALAAALVKTGKTIIHNPGFSSDEKAAASIIQQLGATIVFEDGSLTIQSSGIVPKSNGIDAGESGLSTRLFTPIAALAEQPITVTGKGSLLMRPVDLFEKVFLDLGVAVHSTNGFLPLQIKGPLRPANIRIDGSVSSQYLTGLLMAFAASGAREVSIEVENLKSRPYIDLTLEVMKDFGLKLPENKNYKTFYFDDAQKPQPREVECTIEGDWSGAAFLLVAGAISGDVVVTGLNSFSSQADKAILQALMQAGGIMSIEEKQVRIQRSVLKAFHFNAIDCPDLFPPLAALAVYCDGTTVIEGLHRLEQKESNRAVSIVTEMKKFGADISIQDDYLVIRGRKELKGAAADAHNDHRIAMACAVTALGASGPTTISNAQAINKSYPEFYNHLRQSGATVSLQQ